MNTPTKTGKTGNEKKGVVAQIFGFDEEVLSEPRLVSSEIKDPVCMSAEGSFRFNQPDNPFEKAFTKESLDILDPNVKPNPESPKTSLPSIDLNWAMGGIKAIGNMATETGGAFFDLAKIVSGTENIQASSQKTPAQEDKAIAKVEAEAIIKGNQGWIEQITVNIAEVNQERLEKDLFRIGGDKVIAMNKEQINAKLKRQENFRAPKNLADAVNLRAALKEDEEAVEEAQKRAENQSIDPKQAVKMDAMAEGGTGGAKANLSVTGGGAG